MIKLMFGVALHLPHMDVRSLTATGQACLIKSDGCGLQTSPDSPSGTAQRAQDVRPHDQMDYP